jgi:hypothetical protein
LLTIHSIHSDRKFLTKNQPQAVKPMAGLFFIHTFKKVLKPGSEKKAVCFANPIGFLK